MNFMCVFKCSLPFDVLVLMNMCVSFAIDRSLSHRDEFFLIVLQIRCIQHVPRAITNDQNDQKQLNFNNKPVFIKARQRIKLWILHLMIFCFVSVDHLFALLI